jgi:hypothetical protein
MSVVCVGSTIFDAMMSSAGCVDETAADWRISSNSFADAYTEVFSRFTKWLRQLTVSWR